MAIRPALIYTDNPGSVPATYVLPAGLEVQINSVTATLNGAAASGSFLACLSIYSQDGRLIGRWFPSTIFLAGDSGEVTWSTFLSEEEAAVLTATLAVELNDESTAVSGSWTTVSWDTDVYDPLGYHDLVSNPSRITVPAGLGGYYLILGRGTNDNVGGNAFQGARVRLNGTTVLATHENYGSTAFTGISSLVWAFAELAAGDYVEQQLIYGGAPADDFQSRFQMVGITAEDVCLAEYAGATSFASGSWGTVDLTGEIDPESLHSDTINPSRITAATAGYYLAMAAGGWVPANAGTRAVRITRNGSEVAGTEQHLVGSTGGTEQDTHAWAIVFLGVGDYVECQHRQSSGSALNLTSARLLLIALDPEHVIYANGVGTAAISGNTWTPVELGNEQVDTNGWHSNTSQPSRFTCQADGTYLALVNTLALTPQLVVGARVNLNGAEAGRNALSRGTNALPISSGQSTLVPANAGDYLEPAAYVGDAANTLDRVDCAFTLFRVSETVI